MKRSLLLVGPFCVFLHTLAINPGDFKEDKHEDNTQPKHVLLKRQTGFVGAFPALGGEDKAGKVFTTTASVFTQSDNIIASTKRASLKFDGDSGEKTKSSPEKLQSNVVLTRKLKSNEIPGAESVLHLAGESSLHLAGESSPFDGATRFEREASLKLAGKSSPSDEANPPAREASLKLAGEGPPSDGTPGERVALEVVNLDGDSTPPTRNEQKDDQLKEKELESSNFKPLKRKLFRRNLFQMNIMGKRDEDENIKEVTGTEPAAESSEMSLQQNLGPFPSLGGLEGTVSAQEAELTVLKRVSNVSPEISQIITEGPNAVIIPLQSSESKKPPCHLLNI